MRGFFGLAVALAALAGCRQVFGIHDPEVGDGSVFPPDASVCTAASNECASADVLRTCVGAGATAIDTTCGWGCVASGSPHCGRIVPAGGGATLDDLASMQGLSAVVIAGGTIDGSTGAIAGLRAPGTGVISGIDFEMRGGIAMFRFASLSLTGPIQLGGTNPIVFAADGAIIVGAPVDAQGPCTSAAGGPGGGTGGMFRMNGTGAGAGQGGTSQSSSAGGGAGYGAVGGDANNATFGGAAYGDAEITMLVGGSGGGGAGGGNMPAATGGGGGGAVQLVSNTRIDVSGTINAGGCGAHSGGVSGGGPGAGGGAGGTLLFEAPVVTISATIAVNGGGGSGGDSAIDGQPGQLGTQPAAGGTSMIAAGGDGGAGTMLAGSPGVAGTPRNGGGGGAVGRIRFNTHSGTATITATVSPSLGTTAATQGTATVQ